MKIHLIAIGGAAMHNVAIALQQKGYDVSGSDDEIFDPSKSRLEKHGLLPSQFGWFPDKIDEDLDAIILGMHARKDNPELLKAQALGLKIFSYPEYIYEQSKDKKRVVIGGSHGKTSTTSMILHVLNYWQIANDYMVGAQLDGFDCMVQLSDAELIILEGDEYLSSPIDRRPKFHWYKPDIAVLTGIAWDHINVFPTFENYLDQFNIFAQSIQRKGTLIYFQNDQNLAQIASNTQDLLVKPYDTHEHRIEEGRTILKDQGNEVPVHVFGAHNLQNLSAAKLVCQELGVQTERFYEAIQTFKGAAKRLETLATGPSFRIFKDFAHSPSKLQATTNAVKKQWPKRTLVACMELHTFSSLNSNFLSEYKGAMDAADLAIVYYSPKVVQHKKLAPVSIDQVQKAFDKEGLIVLTESEQVRSKLENLALENTNLLLMSSGNFGGIELDSFSKKLAKMYV